MCLFIWACVYAWTPIFCSERVFNTCVTPGTAQLKSNTLQESITCWVYWQQTELKWPTEKGRGVFIWRARQQNDGKFDHRGCTASKCEHLLDALMGSCWEKCHQFYSTSAIVKRYTHRWKFPQRGIVLFVSRGNQTQTVWWGDTKIIFEV